MAFSEADTPPRAGGVRKGKAQPPVVAKKKSTTGCSKAAGGGSREGHSLPSGRSAQIIEEPALDEKRMKNILKGFGEYPEKYRCVLPLVLEQTYIRVHMPYTYGHIRTYVCMQFVADEDLRG